MRRIVFVFLDGVGLGPSDATNPLAQYEGEAFLRLGNGQRWTRHLAERDTEHHLIRPLDATLGVEGLPQSGTGQATLLTGVNCAKRVGRHFGPFPHSASYDVIDQDNLFHQVQRLFSSDSTPTAFANAFPPQYFTAPRRRQTVTTRCCAAANVELRDIDALRNGKAVAADLTAAVWQKRLQLDVECRSEAEAASHLATIHRSHALTFFEYFLTDKVGHERIDWSPQRLLDQLDQFLGQLLTSLDPQTEALVITSDHGNFEDNTHTQHTRHPVPLIVHGWAAPYFREANDLSDVTPCIVNALTSVPSSPSGSNGVTA